VKKTAAAASAIALGALGTAAAHADEGGAHEWKGLYAGAGAGLTAVHSDWDIDGGEAGFGDASGSRNPKGDTGAIAAKVGYNVQFGPVVAGGEMDYSFNDFEETARFDGGEGAELRTAMKHLGTMRARVGFAMEKALVYMTGGLALSDLKLTYDSLGSPSTKHGSPHVGWVAGGGFEFAAAENVSLFIEGMVCGFHEEGTAKGPFYNDKFDVDTLIPLGRFGVNIKF
jgi:outer membrane immunogenic protein